MWLSYTVEQFMAEEFACVGLDWWEHTAIDGSLYRPTEIALGRSNPCKAMVMVKLGWEAKYRILDVVRMMVEAM